MYDVCRKERKAGGEREGGGEQSVRKTLKIQAGEPERKPKRV